MSEPTVDSIIAKIDAVNEALRKAERLKRRYEYTIGVLIALVVWSWIR